jgi:hypothetical protein
MNKTPSPPTNLFSSQSPIGRQNRLVSPLLLFLELENPIKNPSILKESFSANMHVLLISPIKYAKQPPLVRLNSLTYSAFIQHLHVSTFRRLLCHFHAQRGLNFFFFPIFLQVSCCRNRQVGKARLVVPGRNPDFGCFLLDVQTVQYPRGLCMMHTSPPFYIPCLRIYSGSSCLGNEDLRL